MEFTHTNMTSTFARSHVFTQLMILAIPSVRMTIYRELRDLGRNNHHSERLQTEFKMAGDYLKRVHSIGIEQ